MAEGRVKDFGPQQASWEEVQRIAQQEGRGTRIVGNSFHARGLAVWVLSSAGEVLCSTALGSEQVEDARGKADKRATTTAGLMVDHRAAG